MRTLLLLAALVALLLSAETANAQWGVHRTYNPFTGRIHTQSFARNPWTGQIGASRTVYNPWTGGVRTNTIQRNPWTGLTTRTTSAVNPFTGRFGTYATIRRW